MSPRFTFKNCLHNFFNRGITVLLLLYPLYVHAAALGKIQRRWCLRLGLNCGRLDSTRSLWRFMWTIITLALSFIAIIATGFLVYYGFLYVMSRGEEDNTRRAKAGIAYALIGIVIAGLAAWIVNSVINIQ